MVTAFLALIPQVAHVTDSASLVAAFSKAVPGTTILLEPGQYQGGVFASDLHGSPTKPITIRAADPANPPVFVGGGSAIQLSKVSYLTLSDLKISGARDNGLNIDDGGVLTTPSHHVRLSRIVVSELPAGIHNGVKLSGVEDLQIDSCAVSRWGGSAIDMVGCHRVVVRDCDFRQGGDTGVQCKGGTADVTVERCRFTDYGQRGVNAGGSTGLPFFRPPIDSVPSGKRYEAKDITVQGCTFSGGVAPVAFVGVDGALVRFNTIAYPERWAFRILQETSTPDFLTCRNGRIEDNLLVFRAGENPGNKVNVGSNTAPETFRFARNWWFCADRPNASKPSLPAPEQGGVYGQDPLLQSDLTLAPSSPARNVGAQAFRQKA